MTQEVDILLETEGRTCGELLRMAREKRGLSIEQVEDALKIKAKHIEAIEYDDHEDLPGRVYAIGFIRTYSEYMGFDADKMVSLFKMKGIGRHSTVDLSAYSEVITVSQTPSPALIILCIVMLCVFGFVVGRNNTPESVSPSSSVATDSPMALIDKLEGNVTIAYKEIASRSSDRETGNETVKAVKIAPKPVVNKDQVVKDIVKAKPKTEKSNSDIVIKAVYDSWIQVRDRNGKSVFSGILQMGRSYNVPKGDGYTLMTGNAGGTEVIIGKKSVGVLGKTRQVKKNIRLNHDSLLSKQ